jgi:hypothetical protein
VGESSGKKKLEWKFFRRVGGGQAQGKPATIATGTKGVPAAYRDVK